MASIEEQVLRTAKEIIVKFIESGRVSPAGFPDAFHAVYQTVNTTVRETLAAENDAGPQTDSVVETTTKSRKKKTAQK
jgi:hypothetical protein